MIDQIIVGIYLISVLVLGILVGRDTKTIQDFAIGKRNFSTFVLVSTIFASVIDGSGTLGLAETIFVDGPLSLLSYLGILLSYLTLAFFIAPRLGSFLGLLSSGDILGRLYGPRAKIFMGFATVFESILLTGIQFMAITSIMTYFFDIPANIAAYGSTITILLYSWRGGIRAVTATDVFQFAILIIAIPIICGIAVSKIGGLEGIKQAIWFAHEHKTRTIDYGKHLAIFVSFALPALFPLTIQRMLMAKNTQQITMAFTINALLSFPFYLIVGAIALSAFILMPEVEPNFVFPAIINEILPVGVRGFVIAGLLAVFMSSIDSDLNVASVAITHDVITPFCKLTEKTKLRIARVSSLIIAFMATAAALNFESIFSMIFFVLCVCNSAFFPGYLIGLLGFKPSPAGFWIGLGAAISSVIFFTYAVGLFELYTGIISILLNISILLISHRMNRSEPVAKEQSVKRDRWFVKIFIEPALNLAVRRPRYYNVFAIFVIINTICPFYMLSTDFTYQDQTYLAVYTIGGLLAYLILMREFLWLRIHKFYPFIWYATLTICLPCISLLMCLYSGFSTVWLLDTAVMISLLLILTNVRSLLLIGAISVIAAPALYSISGVPALEHLDLLGDWSLGTHLAMLISCLFLFRRQDIKTYQFLSGKLAHEAKRSTSSLTSSAQFLKAHMPALIDSYRRAAESHSGSRLDDATLDELANLPDRLRHMGLRTSITLNTLFERIYPKPDQKANLAEVNILTCAMDAVEDPSFSKEQRSRIFINTDHSFEFIGNGDEITQTLINMIENATHAIEGKPDGLIEIWARDNTLYIKDNGKGIAAKDLPNIFDDFFSTKSTLGQGLSYAKLVMAEHLGHIRCRSKENGFTQFELTFPPLRAMPSAILLKKRIGDPI